MEHDENSTILHVAIVHGAIETIQCCLENKICIGRQDSNGNTPLHIAVLCKHNEIIKLLIESGENVNQINGIGKIPLHYAVEQSLTTIAALLIDNGSNVNVKDLNGRSPFYYAVYLKNLNIIKNILKSSVQHTRNIINIELLLNCPDAIYNDAVIELIYETYSAEMDTKTIQTIDFFEILLTIIKNKNFKLFKLIYNLCNEININNVNDIDGDNINSKYLHYCITQNSNEIFKFLINNIDNTFAAAGNIEKVNMFKRTPLHYAIIYHNEDIIKLLLDKNVNVNIIDENNATPLHYALKNNISDDIIQSILFKTNNFNVIDKYAQTLLHIAIKHKKSLDIFEYILKNDKNINITDSFQRNALHLIIIYTFKSINDEENMDNTSDISVNNTNTTTTTNNNNHHHNRNSESIAIKHCQLLIEHNINVNAIDKYLKPPLYYAIRYQFYKIIKLLLKNDAIIFWNSFYINDIFLNNTININTNNNRIIDWRRRSPIEVMHSNEIKIKKLLALYIVQQNENNLNVIKKYINTKLYFHEILCMKEYNISENLSMFDFLLNNEVLRNFANNNLKSNIQEIFSEQNLLLLLKMFPIYFDDIMKEYVKYNN